MHNARSRKLAVGLVIAAVVVPAAVFLGNWLIWKDVWAGELAALFLGIPIGLALLVAAVIVLAGRRR